MLKKIFLFSILIVSNANAQRTTPPSTVLPNNSNETVDILGQLPSGSLTRLQLDTNGNLYVTGSGGGGDTSIQGPQASSPTGNTWYTHKMLN